MSPNSQNEEPMSLQRQLEVARFERALEISEEMAEQKKNLTITELARLNTILVGKDKNPDFDPWRKGAVTLPLPSGRTETLALMGDPRLTTREKIHKATEIAENGNGIDAAVGLYADLVLAHPFEDANRRSAVLAAHYYLTRYGAPVSGLALHELGLGDLREPGELESLRETISQMAKFAAKRRS